MITSLPGLPSAPVDAALLDDIAVACSRIAPTWPLDRFIAVNPYWGWRSVPVAAAAARLGVLAGTSLTMPHAWFAEEWRAGRLDLDEADAIAAAMGEPGLAQRARDVVTTTPPNATPAPLPRMALVTDLRDASGSDPVAGTTWTAHVTHQIGQHLASWCDEGQATWRPHERLWAGWREDPTTAHTMRAGRGVAWTREMIHTLPADARAAIAAVLADLRIPVEGRTAYLGAVLASVNGWAAWCAYLRWQARLDGGDDDAIEELLAVRLAWEWLLAHDLDDTDGLAQWAAGWTTWEDHAVELGERQRVNWLLQSAVEHTYQASLAAGFPHAQQATTPVAVQAAFCIDVRSEVFRRAFEAVSPQVRTRGFAGFFGLPIAYSPAGSQLTRPQLPGLLTPSLTATDAAEGTDLDALARRRERVLGGRLGWDHLGHTPSAMFPFVETTGLWHAPGLLADSLGLVGRGRRWEDEGTARGDLGTPHLALVADDPAAAAGIAHRVLTNMGLTKDFPPLVLLCGHGSSTTNNPHAAGLDCGACGGLSGEVNARVLAHLLNADDVRAGLRGLGVDVPAGTWFVPGLHDTTTDTVTLFDTEAVPEGLRAAVVELEAWLRLAGAAARAERAPRLGLAHLAGDAAALEQAVQRRSRDWAQTRPEWGLADNAAFVVAPRWRTSHMNLGGRVFLHDYDWTEDTDLSVLTLVMTAPMVVTNWINLQYHASTVDHRRYGAGDKTLHNVVGGRVGVFEGNGGDLRIGLATQSLHDGERLCHRPLRLSVFIEAPAEGIDRVIAEHQVVRDLVGHGWLHLLRIEPADGTVQRWTATGWAPVP